MSDTKPKQLQSPPLGDLSDSSLMLFAALEEAVEQGNHERAREAQRLLKEREWGVTHPGVSA